jgi:hypothetical protein
MRKLALIVPIAAVLFAPSWLRADGCNPNTQDCGGYKDEAPVRPRARAQSYSYAYSVRPARGRWECPPEFSRRECRRIQAEVDLRRAREVRRMRPRYIERAQYRSGDRYDDDHRPGFGGKRCIARVVAIGGQRPTETMAIGSAWKTWRSTVRATPGMGEAYMDDRYAIKKKVECHITGANGVLDRCTVSAVPCR